MYIERVEDMTPSEIASDYIRNYRACARAELDEYRKLPSLRDAIMHASRCHRLPSGKRHSHQYRIPRSVLLAVEQKLQSLRRRLSQAESFEALHAEIEHEIGGLRGIGPLTVYDIAHRIGSFLRLKPAYVYLHSGAGIGARMLGFTGTTLDPRSLPSAFSRLTPDEIEDCLCIYKDALGPSGLCARAARTRPGCMPPLRSVRRC
jgi:hypothetical protein